MRVACACLSLLLLSGAVAHAESKKRVAAAKALYGKAHQALYEEKNYEAAVKYAELYERRYPKGKHAEQVMWIEILALYETDFVRCREVCRQYLTRFPPDEHTDEFRLAHIDKALQIAKW